MSQIHVHRWGYWGQPRTRTTEVREWHQGLCAQDIVPSDMRARAGLAVHVNGERIPQHMLDRRPICPGDHVDVGIRPAGAETVTAALVSAAVSTGVGLVLSYILPKPKGPKRRDDNESARYAWNGQDNDRVAGQPRKVAYGELPFAPQIIDQFVRTTNVPPVSVLHILLSLGEGPIHSIGGVTVDNPPTNPLKAGDPSYPLPVGITLNDNALENFRGVEGHVRLGTSEQLAIPGFEEIHTVSPVGSTLTQQETSATTNIGTAWSLTSYPYNSNDASVQAIWTQYAQAFDLESAADAYTITINFPLGLYRIDASGNVQDAYFRGLVRYREFDGGGSPITTGGDNGDGWVYAEPAPRLVARHQGAFPYELSGSFFTPAGFTPGVQGSILACDSTGMRAFTSLTNGGAAANAIVPWTAGQAIDEFTFECWYKPASLPTTGTGTANTVRPIVEWLSTGSFRGISIRLERFTADVGTDTAQERWRLRVYWGNGTVTLIHLDESPSLATLRFDSVRYYHIAITYKRNASGGNERWRFYVDGVRVREYLNGASEEVQAAAAPIRLCETLGTPSGTVQGFGRLDEVRFWRTERTSTQIFDSYGGGAGTFGVNAAEIVAGWHFDNPDNINNYSFAKSFDTVGLTNRITTAGGATVGDTVNQLDAVVFRPGSGTMKRARYRVQLLRFNLKSTSTAIGDQSDWESIDGRVDMLLAYPNTPLLALKIPATDQLNTTTPKVVVPGKWRVLKVWDRISTETPSFVETWTASPAWVLYDQITNARYGRGGEFDSSNVDLQSFAEWEDYCAEKVYDGLGRTALHETDTGVPISTLQYDSTLHGGAGGIDVFFRVGVLPPAKWKVGGFLGFSAFPYDGVTTFDFNVGVVPGIEIGSIFFNGGVWVVRLKWLTATYGDPWPDGAFIEDNLASPVTGNIEGREERFRFDGVFDTFRKPWDAILHTCGIGRAMPLDDGAMLRVRMAKPRDHVGFVGHSSIKPGSFRVAYSGRIERPNLYVSEILDRDQGYKLKPIEQPDPELESVSFEGAINRDNIELFGIVRRSHALRHMNFMLAVNRLMRKQGEFITGFEGIRYEVGDVIVLSHNLVPWGKSGRFSAAQTGTTITFDRSVTIDALETWYVLVRFNAIGQVGTGSPSSDYMEVREITSAAGTYAAGASVTIASAFSIDPQKSDPFLVYKPSQMFLAEVVETTLTAEFERRVKWIEYQADVYDVDNIEDIPGELIATQASQIASTIAPAAAKDLEARESVRFAGEGTFRSEIGLAWTLDPDTAANVRSMIVWSRVAGDDGSPWEDVARVNGAATSVRVRTNTDTPGTQLEFAVQLIGTTGERLGIDQSARTLITTTGRMQRPDPPTNLRATMNGDQVTYAWDPPANSRGLSYELRRGNWFLGQLIGVTGVGQTSYGPCADWASGKTNERGDAPPIVIVRAKDLRGQYSDAAILEDFSPSVPGAVLMADANVLDQGYEANQCWEDYDDPWLPSGSPVATDPAVDGLVVEVDEEGRSVLVFDTGYLTGTYTTGVQDITPLLRPERAYVEAYVVATQVPPITIDQMELGLEHPLASGRTLEGVLGSPGCTLTIEWRFKVNPGGDYGEWLVYRPGAYFVGVPQFRITATRPTTDWQVRIERFGTRLTSIPPARNERNDLSLFLQRRRSRHG